MTDTHSGGRLDDRLQILQHVVTKSTKESVVACPV